MSYSVVFTGEINPSFTQNQVVENLAVIFRKDTNSIEKLFTGKKIIIKRDLDLESATKYQTVLVNAGAICELLDQATIGAGSEQSARSRHLSSPAPANKTMNTLSVAEAGATIIEHTKTPEPNIDVSKFSVAAAGETIVQPAMIEPVNVSVTSYEISPTGTALSDDKPAEALHIDTSKMSMAEAGSAILDKEK